MVPEAKLVETNAGLAPEGDGWFVLNARDAAWWREDRGHYTEFDGEPPFPELGFRLHVLLPGRAIGMYHGELGQEDFLVLAGDCLLVIEGEERQLRQWDFVHCPPWTEHVFVGAGNGPCLVFMVGARHPGFDIRYPVNALAAKHGASVATETRDVNEAYARSPLWRKTPYIAGWLP